MAVEIITVQELADYLGIDIIDTQVTNNLTRVINSADSWLRSGVDPQYLSDDPKCKELMLIIAADLYDNRSLSSSVASTVRKLVRDYTLQLKAEALRRAEEDNG
jgi:hypothetical protein